MAAVGTVLSVAPTLFAVLDSPISKKIWSLMRSLGSESDLQDLKNTVSTVNAVLLDAEAKQGLSHEELNWIEKLKEAVYDADDLLDEFKTIAEQKQLMDGGEFSKEVRLFFSRFNQLGVAYNLSHGIKNIRKKLDAIHSDHSQFGSNQFGITPMSLEPTRRRNRETCSYVYEQNILGREDEKKAIIDILLDSSVQEDVSFITIVGIGGVGKTALAQLVYNDEEIKKEFPLRLWICVADQDKKQFDVKAVLCKILESATSNKHEDFELEVVQNKLQGELQGRKYLLILDDIWNETRHKFLKLGEFLMCGGRGSRVVVTARSMETGRVIGNGRIFELQGLTPDNSWLLFKKMAFDEGHEESDPGLIEIGQEIVRKCANVPLAITMVGSLLYGQGKNEWLSFQNRGLASIGGGAGDDIISILKLSYYHLDSHLKSCFSFCSIFPKDFVMEKGTLISLWMAQGYVKPLDKMQSIEKAGEEYFLILLQRFFFQDIKKDRYGEIISCKIHDLMHDIAQEAVGKEIYVANSTSSKLDEKLRHMNNIDKECIERSLAKSKIRTYLLRSPKKSPAMDNLVANLKFLRALELKDCLLNRLPSAIGELLHLRYLDLSDNEHLRKLPKELTKLHNLQTLKLSGCMALQELPKDLSLLRKLRVLILTKCLSLTCMPLGMDKLTCLCTLTNFKVIEADSNGKEGVGKLKDLQALTNLKGKLKIDIDENVAYVKTNGGGGYLRNKEHLNKICVTWPLLWRFDSELNIVPREDERRVDYEEAMLEDLQPHPNLKGLTLENYCGIIPSWAREDKLGTSLPNLVKIKLEECKQWPCLPLLSELRHLKSLAIAKLPNLEYIEYINMATGSRSRTAEFVSFPCLEELELTLLPKLKGWWKSEEGVVVGDHDVIKDSSNGSNKQPLLSKSLPRLSQLKIFTCENLISFPLCPNVIALDLTRVNEGLKIIEGDQKEVAATNSLSSEDFNHPKLRRVRTDNVGYLLKSVPSKAFQCLSSMAILDDEKLESLSELREVFQSCSSSLQFIMLWNCSKLRTLCGALEHLTALKSLRLHRLPNLIDDNGEDNGIPWKSLDQSLRSLNLYWFSLVELPKGMQHLSCLQTLSITECSRMNALPEWISCLSSLQVLELTWCGGLTSLPYAIQHLTSLRQLYIMGCSATLKVRCQNPNGKDWPKIQHIPDIYISTDYRSTYST